MLIDAFAADWMDVLDARADQLAPSDRLFLLLDGAFVLGLHKMLPSEQKILLFAALPGCTAAVQDASPFLTSYAPSDKAMRLLLKRCNRWPMVSVIETHESLDTLADRLSAWCVIEADRQRFNFRFSDTRRLLAIFKTLTPAQRAQIAGPAVRWSYIDRDGTWRGLAIDGLSADTAAEPSLTEQQFANLVADSQVDELTVLLSDRGHDVFRYPSRSHALLNIALQAAVSEKLEDEELIGWCESFWSKDLICDVPEAIAMLKIWKESLYA
jgi:hypothetical protein